MTSGPREFDKRPPVHGPPAPLALLIGGFIYIATCNTSISNTKPFPVLRNDQPNIDGGTAPHIRRLDFAPTVGKFTEATDLHTSADHGNIIEPAYLDHQRLRYCATHLTLLPRLLCQNPRQWRRRLPTVNLGAEDRPGTFLFPCSPAAPSLPSTPTPPPATGARKD